MASEAVGDTYKISVSIPPSYCCADLVTPNLPKPESGVRYPVAYVLDSDLLYPVVQQTAWLASLEADASTQGMVAQDLPKMIVVGIGYPHGQNPLEQRNRDMLPGAGSEAFREFFRDELMPLIESEYQGDPNDKTIVGHSLGGLFSINTLFEDTSLFDRYFIGSPPFFPGSVNLKTVEENYAAENDDLNANVFLFVGGEEGTLQDWYPDAVNENLKINNPVTNVENLAKALSARGYESLVFDSHTFETETHLTVMSAATARGLRQLHGIIE